MAEKYKILFLYSNPTDTIRLRLDKEQKNLDLIFQNLNFDLQNVTRILATNINDITNELIRNKYDIIHFSGHGSSTGFYIEDVASDSSHNLSAQKLMSFILKMQPQLKLALFISCFSESSVGNLNKIAPYVITISGIAKDDGAIEFVKSFYYSLLVNNYIEKAFSDAHAFLSLRDFELDIRLNRRNDVKDISKIIKVKPFEDRDSIFIDISEVEGRISELNIDIYEFISLLKRKIRLHAWIFDSSRENAYIPIGIYIGVFSWINSNDNVKIHKILVLKDNIETNVFGVWSDVIVAHNDLSSCKYRTQPSQNPRNDYHNLSEAIKDFKANYSIIMRNSEVIETICQTQFKVTISTFKSNIEKSEFYFKQERYSQTIIYLETILSSLHDLVNSLTKNLSKN